MDTLIVVILTSSEITINKLAIFAIHEIPEWIVSDNGPGFTIQEFNCFGQKWNQQYSDIMVMSNKLPEHTIQTIKQGISKLKCSMWVRIDIFFPKNHITHQTSIGIILHLI